MRTETITIYSYPELSEEAKATAYKAWEPDYAFEADNRRTLEAFFSACCEDVRYTQSQEYFADFAENNELEFYENGICIRHR